MCGTSNPESYKQREPSINRTERTRVHYIITHKQQVDALLVEEGISAPLNLKCTEA